MIPKVIHYCWFGGNEKPEEVEKCIRSWKEFCPDYQLIEWNESNCDIEKNVYISQAYRAKKWAFVTDFVRLDVVYQYGGIYLDTDVQLVKSLDPLRSHHAFAGMENVMGNELSVNTGLGFGAEKGNTIIKAWLDQYKELEFQDESGNMDLLTTPARTSAYLRTIGWVPENKIQDIEGIVIYPTEFFSPKVYGTGVIHLTDKTYSIHHYSESWKDESERKMAREWRNLVNQYGEKNAGVLMALERKRIGRIVSPIVKTIMKWTYRG